MNKKFSLLNLIPSPIPLLSDDYKIIFLNDTGKKAYGVNNTKTSKLGNCYKIFHDYDKPCYQYGEECPLKFLLENQDCERVTVNHLHRNDYYKIELSRNKKNKHIFFGTHTRISDLTARIQELRKDIQNASIFKELFYNNSSIMYLLDQETLTIIDINETAIQFYGYTKEEITGKPIYDTINPFITRNAILKNLDLAINRKQKVFESYTHRMKNGELKNVEISITPVHFEGKMIILVGVNDITERLKCEKIERENKKFIEHLAYHDVLTGLPNRAQFYERINAIYSRAKRHRLPIGLLLVDLDDFKIINDTFGHNLGDDLLKKVAKSIKNIIREEDELFRIGGDEFVIIADAFQSGADLVSLCERIINEFKNPVKLKGKKLSIGATIGIALDIHGNTGREEILKIADEAMYEAKKNGKNRWGLKQINPHRHT